MIFKKILLLLVTSVLIFSCTQDDIEQQNSDSTFNLTADLSQYDNSDMGTYKGVFTTLDSEYRGSLVVSLRNNDIAIAALSLSSGEVVILVAPEYRTGDAINDLSFIVTNETMSNTSFTFSVEEDGGNPLVSDVIYDNIDSSILIAKDTSRDPVTTISGTYTCDNCATVVPGFMAGAQTFNSITIAAGNGASFTTQFLLNGAPQNGNGTQNGCVKVGNLWTCSDVTGSTITNFGTLNWTGSHQYPNGGGSQCSNFTGTWSLNLDDDTLTGTFDDDVAGGC